MSQALLEVKILHKKLKHWLPNGPKIMTDVELRKFWSTFLNRSLVTGGLNKVVAGFSRSGGVHVTKEF